MTTSSDRHASTHVISHVSTCLAWHDSLATMIFEYVFYWPIVPFPRMCADFTRATSTYLRYARNCASDTTGLSFQLNPKLKHVLRKLNPRSHLWDKYKPKPMYKVKAVHTSDIRMRSASHVGGETWRQKVELLCLCLCLFPLGAHKRFIVFMLALTFVLFSQVWTRRKIMLVIREVKRCCSVVFTAACIRPWTFRWKWTSNPLWKWGMNVL